MATTKQPDEDPTKTGRTQRPGDTVDPANDPRRDQRRKGEDEDRLPSSALNPQERHDRDIEDLKAAGHDFNPPASESVADKDAPEGDPKLQQVTVEEHRTRREDGLEVPMPPRAATEDPKHPLHHLKDV
jgi:hypothetical protein